ncbi:DUF2207 domain-containing protein [Mucilaginibacter sp.]|uniref:DUF2207 domain-containing protein n=1 Tax=Mucilaginibacter sp. TaxID=1882438 RepID=UPI0035BBCB48
MNAIRNTMLVLCTILCMHLYAQPVDTTREHILNFHSDIVIDTTGLISITEHIKVYAKGDVIQHGIVRFIPLYRKDIFGSNKKVDFEIVEVKKDNVSVPFKAVDESQSRKIYIGDADSTLTPGIYDYTIIYRSKGHIGFFDNYDELYWNVTGNKWDFDIEKASATVWLPGKAEPGNRSCYTGAEGSTASNCSSTVNIDHTVTFATDGKLETGQGFTVAIAFTGGIIKRPGTAERLYSDYLGLIAGIILVLVSAGGFYLLWRKYGKDPESPVIVPSFQVPNNWSPAVIRYVYKKTADNKATAVAMISIAVKKAIRISMDKNSSRNYIFYKLTNDRTTLADEEQSLFNALFQDAESVSTQKDNASTFSNARNLFALRIKAQIKLTDFFIKNTLLAIWPGIAILAFLVGYMLLCGFTDALMILIFLPFICIGLLVFSSGVKNIKTSLGTGVFLLFFGGLFGGIPLIAMISLSTTLSLIPVLVTISVLVIYLIYALNISRYTALGAETQSKLKGFKMYLETAEENRLNMINAPEKTPELFEKFLPYAVALDVENAWAAKFETILSEASYEPDWYNGNNHMPYRSFVSNVPTSFYSGVNISPASSSGSSSGSSGSSSWSSGSSGGGSSGGGGGGGGGGGW